MARRGTALTRRFRLQIENTLPCVRDDIIAERWIALTC